jgi:hypothetical protein
MFSNVDFKKVLWEQYELFKNYNGTYSEVIEEMEARVIRLNFVINLLKEDEGSEYFDHRTHMMVFPEKRKADIIKIHLGTLEELRKARSLYRKMIEAAKNENNSDLKKIEKEISEMFWERFFNYGKKKKKPTESEALKNMMNKLTREDN